MMAHRVNLSFSDADWQTVRQHCLQLQPYLPIGTTLREILLQLVTTRNRLLQPVTAELAGTDLAPKKEKKEKEKKEEKRREEGECEGEKKPAPPSKPAKPGSRLAPQDLTARILADLNEKAGTAFRPSGKRVRQLIALRMAEGYTEKDFMEVHRKKCREWAGTDMARYLQYETLYGTKFERYLGQADVGPKQQLAFTEGDRRSQRWDRRKEPGYYDQT